MHEEPSTFMALEPAERRAILVQEMNEERFNRKHIDVKIRTAIEDSPEMVEKITQGVVLVQAYMDATYTYTTKAGEVKVFETKMARIAQLKEMNVRDMVVDMFVGIAYCLREELYTSITAQLASRLRLSDRTEAITTVAEMIAVLCATDAYDINKEDKRASFMLVSKIPLPDALVSFIENSQFLPPMVCEPLPLTHNYSSGYLTHNDSLILGSGNHHDGDICLDTLNIMNNVALRLDTEFLSKIEEMPTFVIETPEQEDAWMAFKRQSYYFYALIAQQGNRMFFNHKVDKRGRAYSQGYHINTQGTSFKKAMCEFAKEELVEGVPA